MTALLAMVIGIMLTAVAVIIAGFVLNLVMLAISRSLKPVHQISETGRAVVIQFKAENNTTGMAEAVEEAA